MTQLQPLNCRQVNQYDLVDYLSSIGFIPHRVSRHQYWYCSPLRSEKTPSFKVDRRLNCWYDHGLGRGGTLVDFALLFYGCTIPQLLQQFNKAALPFHPPDSPSRQVPEVPKSIDIIDVLPLGSVSLLRYLKQRGIDKSVALHYCREVQFLLHGKPYHAIGFQNDAGGYELRNPWFKGSTSPKAVTTLKDTLVEPRNLRVFEGFFDFLSYQSISRKAFAAQDHYIVLNSLAFLQKSRDCMEQYSQITLYLDRDKSGLKATKTACAWSDKYKDASSLYSGFKDLSAWQEVQSKKGLKRKGPRF